MVFVHHSYGTAVGILTQFGVKLTTNGHFDPIIVFFSVFGLTFRIFRIFQDFSGFFSGFSFFLQDFSGFFSGFSLKISGEL